MTLAQMVRKARRDLDISIKEAAHDLDISPSHLHAIERGKKLRPKMDVLYRLASYYDIEIDDICVAAYRIPIDVFDLVARSKIIMAMLRNEELREHPELMEIKRKKKV